MFGILKKRLKESVDWLSKRAEEKEAGEEASEEKPGAKEPERKAKAPEKARVTKQKEEIKPAAKAEKPPEEPSGIFSKSFFGLKKKVTIREFSEKDIDDFFAVTETGLMQAGVALEAIDFLRDSLKRQLVGKEINRSQVREQVSESFSRAVSEIVNQGEVDLEKIIKGAKKEGRPATFIFLGFNGAGKTTCMAKVAKRLMGMGIRPVLAAADTFRAASIEQLEFHGEKLGLKVIKHQYGADPAAVIFDARKHAESKGFDVVLADTAGRMHTNVNLMDELKKIVRVNKPDLKILVVDSLTGNDVVHQVRTFSDQVGIDAMILTKMDVNEKGGSILSACYTAKKPVIFIGTGQEYGDMEEFNPEKFVKELLE